MKKDLIFVGNKLISKNIASTVDDMDYVMRCNRMNNLGVTGTKIDGLYFAAGETHVYLYKGGAMRKYIPTAKQIFSDNLHEEWLSKHWQNIISEEQYKNRYILNFTAEGYDRIIPGHDEHHLPTSTLILIDVITHDPKWADVYNFYFTGLDIENRERLMAHDYKWAATTHVEVGKAEANYLKGLMKQGIIKHIKDV